MLVYAAWVVLIWMHAESVPSMSVHVCMLGRVSCIVLYRVYIHAMYGVINIVWWPHKTVAMSTPR